MKFSVDLILSLSTHLQTSCLLESSDESLLQYCHQVSEDHCLISNNDREFFPLIVGHGLGARNPKTKTHLTDDVVDILRRGAKQSTGTVDSVLSFTARGHGASTGWQQTAESDLEQFTWNRLADDMIAVGNYFNIKQAVVSGCSMGSATAFYSALKYPEKVKGLIMAKPPTGTVFRHLF
jgi:pimeloyl-ACP methyl ester carboxylesterase